MMYTETSNWKPVVINGNYRMMYREAYYNDGKLSEARGMILGVRE